VTLPIPFKPSPMMVPRRFHPNVGSLGRQTLRLFYLPSSEQSKAAIQIRAAIDPPCGAFAHSLNAWLRDSVCLGPFWLRPLLCRTLLRLERGNCRRDLGQDQEIVAVRQNSRIDAGIGDNERRPRRKSLGNLLTDILGNLNAIEHACGIVSFEADRRPLSLGAPWRESHGEDVSPEGLLRLAKGDRHVKYGAEILPDK